MPNFQKGFIPVIVLIGIFILLGTAVGAGGYYLMNQRNQPPNPSAVSNPKSLPNSSANPEPSSTSLTNTDWNIAENKWKYFVQEYTDIMRKIDSQTPAAKLQNHVEDRELKQITDPLIEKYLSKYHIFTDTYFTFALRSDGEIIVIGDTMPGNTTHFSSAPNLELLAYSKFIQTLKLTVPDDVTANDMVKLKKVVEGHGFTKNADLANWKFQTSRESNKWSIKLQYTGDPNNSIMISPNWEIKVDENNVLADIKEMI